MSGRPKKGNQDTGKPVDKPVGVMVPGRNGGSIWRGAPANPVPGPGRPPNEVRAKYLELGATKGFDFISDLLDGKVQAYLVGKCEKCRHEQGFDAETMEYILEQIKVSVDQRLKANEQAMKYGTQQPKELVIANDNAASFFDCISAAATELFGAEGSDALKSRAMVLMEGRK